MVMDMECLLVESGCSAPADGYVNNGDDCDDNDATVFDSCDGPTGGTTGGTTGQDADGDGQVAEADGGTDCDDDDSSVYDGAPEVCDDVNNDCDGDVDEDPGTTWHLDNDGDGLECKAEVFLDAMHQPPVTSIMEMTVMTTVTISPTVALAPLLQMLTMMDGIRLQMVERIVMTMIQIPIQMLQNSVMV